MATTPSWQAARAGMPGDLDGTNASAHINQLLGTHAVTPVYQGNLIYATSQQTTTYWAAFYWINPANVSGIPNVGLNAYDFDQAFTMSSGSTAIGRIQVPLQPVGNAADVQVTLYPDNAGSPNLNSPITSTTIPAAVLVNLAATDGLPTDAQSMFSPAYNTTLFGPPASFNWTQPAVSLNGSGNYATPVTSGDYTILLGGYDTTAGATISTVATVQYLGGQTLSGPTPQPSLPQGAWSGMACATGSAVIFAGGVNGTNYLNNVWAASWNPNTGTVGSWTAQTALPAKTTSGGCAAWGDTVYVVGGTPDGSATNATAAVYYANATNGQIQSWTTGPALPQPVDSPYVAVVGNWLIVAGGRNTAGTTISTVYYARIHSDGSLSGWASGPALPTATFAYSPGWNTVVTDSALILDGGATGSGTNTSAFQILNVTPDGLAPTWQTQLYDSGTYQVGAYPAGNPGEWEIFNLHLTSYNAVLLAPVPVMSIPLPATGLTGGGTYHLLFHQVGGDANNYVQLGEIVSSSQQWLYASRYSGGPWTAHANYGIMLNVYDQGQTGALLHTWEDPGSSGMAARTSTFVNDFRGRLLGVCEATALPNNPLDSNPNFATGVAPWTAVGGTITQSSAQTHGGNAYSGLLTPNGTASSAYALSELLPVTGGQWYTANGWLYSTPGYSSVSLSVIWYDHAGNSLASSNHTVSLAAATWTQATNTFQAPAGAAQAALAPAEGGTPPVSATLYLSNITLTAADTTTLASVAQVNYGQGIWPPTGVTQLN